MATLILEQDGRRRGTVLNGRLVIGRRVNNHIAINDRSVSRIHAWIGQNEGRHFIADTGSRTGTHVNGRRMHGRRPLADGDQILIGPMRLIYHAASTLPGDVEAFDAGAPRLEEDDGGIFVDCACGAPIWAPWECGGRLGRCRDCGRMIELPLPARVPLGENQSNDTMAPGIRAEAPRQSVGGVLLATASPAPVEDARARGVRARGNPVGARGRADEASQDVGDAPPPADQSPSGQTTDTFCGACQSPIGTLEETITCPECGVVFHADCWKENLGCSSYGCKQVGILAPAQPPDAASGEAVGQTPASSPAQTVEAPIDSREVRWDFLLLPASLLAAIGGLLAFGGPSVLLGVGMAIYSVRRPIRGRRLSAAAMMVSVIGSAAGAAFSTYWWLAAPAAGKLGL